MQVFAAPTISQYNQRAIPIASSSSDPYGEAAAAQRKQQDQQNQGSSSQVGQMVGEQFGAGGSTVGGSAGSSALPASGQYTASMASQAGPYMGAGPSTALPGSAAASGAGSSGAMSTPGMTSIASAQAAGSGSAAGSGGAMAAAAPIAMYGGIAAAVAGLYKHHMNQGVHDSKEPFTNARDTMGNMAEYDKEQIDKFTGNIGLGGLTTAPLSFAGGESDKGFESVSEAMTFGQTDDLFEFPNQYLSQAGGAIQDAGQQGLDTVGGAIQDVGQQALDSSGKALSGVWDKIVGLFS